MGNPFALPRPKTLEERIARRIFDCMSDIDHDMADWIHFRDDCMEAAANILKMREFRIRKGNRPPIIVQND